MGMHDNAIEAFWQDFLKRAGLPEDTRYFDVFAFGRGKAMGDELLALVLAGQKTATTSAVPSYEATGDPLPAVGGYSVVLDGDGAPRCVIETTAIAIQPFREVSWEMARREGEDENLESWREGHIRYFTGDGEDEGYTFTWDMPVVFEDFKVVYQTP